MTRNHETTFVNLYKQIEASRKDVQKIKECRKAFIKATSGKGRLPLIHAQFLHKLLNEFAKEAVGMDDYGVIKCYSVITKAIVCNN